MHQGDIPVKAYNFSEVHPPACEALWPGAIG